MSSLEERMNARNDFIGKLQAENCRLKSVEKSARESLTALEETEWFLTQLGYGFDRPLGRKIKAAIATAKASLT